MAITLDNMSQSFSVVDEPGIFVSKVELFFKEIDDSVNFNPVRFEMRTMENGYPGSRVIPFSEVVLKTNKAGATLPDNTPNIIRVSSDGQTNPTIVEFKNPVFLKTNGGDTEYCFSLVTNSSEYKLWITNSNNPNSSNVPRLGVFFKSSNNFVWIPSLEENIVFKLYRAKFTANSPVTAIFENNYNKKGLGNPGDDPENIKYNIAHPNIECLHPSDTTLNMSLKTTPTSGSLESSGRTCLNRKDLFFNSERTITQVSGTSSATLNLDVNMETSNDFVSPCIPLGGPSPAPSIRLVGNSINSKPFNTKTTTARYITKPIQLENESNYLDIKMTAHVPSQADIEVYYRATIASAENVEDASFVKVDPEGTIVKSAIETNEFYEVSFVKENIPSFDIFEVLILMASSNTSAVPRIKDLRIIAGI